MLSVIIMKVTYKPFMLSVVMLSVVMLNVIILRIVAPLQTLKGAFIRSIYECKIFKWITLS